MVYRIKFCWEKIEIFKYFVTCATHIGFALDPLHQPLRGVMTHLVLLLNLQRAL